KDGWCLIRPCAFLQVSRRDRRRSLFLRDRLQDKRVASQNLPTAPDLGSGYRQSPRLLAACGHEILPSSSEYVQLQAPRIFGARSQRKLDRRALGSVSVVSGHLRRQISPAKPIRFVVKRVRLPVV